MKRLATSGMLYYRKGKVQQSLFTKDEKEGLRLIKVMEIRIDYVGVAATRLSVGDLVGELDDDGKIIPGPYLLERKKQSQGKLERVRPIRISTYEFSEYLWRKHLLKFFGKDKLVKITPVRWRTYCENCPVSDLKNHRGEFGVFLLWCKRKGYIEGLPDITEVPHHVRRRRYVITPGELEIIFKHAKDCLPDPQTGFPCGLLLFLSLALFNGLRRKEIMTLKWNNINLFDRYLVIEDVSNKMGRRRSIPINPLIVGLLNARQLDLKGCGSKSNWVFPNRINGKRHADVSGLKTSWKKVMKKAFEDGVTSHITWHDFRATYEKYAHLSTEFTDTQKEKFADASMDVQQKIYVTMDHNDLRGLEDVVQVPLLTSLIQTQIRHLGKNKGI
jgi:hypothetical protein